jgi:biofilm PGA synthesis N-glycosyltransferase PgaC
LTWLAIISRIVLGLSALYFVLVLLALAGLFRLKPGGNRCHHRVSVVVAARNEQNRIAGCLQALRAQKYPRDRYEVVVVDDGSVDDTAGIVERFALQDGRIRLLASPVAPGPLQGKKRALQAGIEHSRGDIILVTDADCRPGPAWIQTMVEYFEPQVGLVAGHVRQEGSRLWQKLRSLERLSLSAVSAGAIGWDRGLTATGGNLAYRREVFEQVGGFRDLAGSLSGDDDLFVQLVSRRTRWELRYAFQPQAAVDTDPPATLKDFVAQERRRSSKWRFYPLWVRAAAAEAFLTNLSLMVTLPLSLALPGGGPLPLAAFGLKALGEFLLLLKAGYLLGQGGLLRYFPAVAVLHIPYLLVFSVWGTLGQYRWKSGGNDSPAAGQQMTAPSRDGTC